MCAWPVITAGGNDNIFPATIQKVFVREATSNKWQTLGSIANSEMNTEDFTNPDTMKRDRSMGSVKFDAKFHMQQCSLIELELLPILTNGANDFLFQLVDAAAIPATTAVPTVGWALVTATQVKGIHAKAVLDGDESNPAHIEIEMQGAVALTGMDALLKASIADVDFVSSADSATAVFYTIGTYTLTKDGGNVNYTNLKKSFCGVASVTLADHAGGSPQSLTPILAPKISFDFKTTNEGVRWYPSNAVDIAISFEWGSTVSGDLLNLDTIPTLEVDAVITMISGLVITLSNQTGNKTKFQNAGTMDKSRSILYTLNGIILKSYFAAAVS